MFYLTVCTLCLLRRFHFHLFTGNKADDCKLNPTADGTVFIPCMVLKKTPSKVLIAVGSYDVLSPTLNIREEKADAVKEMFDIGSQFLSTSSRCSSTSNLKRMMGVLGNEASAQDVTLEEASAQDVTSEDVALNGHHNKTMVLPSVTDQGDDSFPSAKNSSMIEEGFNFAIDDQCRETTPLLEVASPEEMASEYSRDGNFNIYNAQNFLTERLNNVISRSMDILPSGREVQIVHI